jgi:predicted PhzF superfamily epimerase YddE/YHI9
MLRAAAGRISRLPLSSTATRSCLASSLTLPIYQLDAFASKPFSGNPAAIHPLEEWLPDETLLSIAAENNLSETAFTVPIDDGAAYHLRWFTPTLEVDMCGHATLATAALILGKLEPNRRDVEFETRSGRLLVRRAADPGRLTLEFPTWPVGASVEPPPALVEALRGRSAPIAAHEIEPLHGAPYYLFLYESEEEVGGLQPVFGEMEANVTATAAASSSGGCDFVSRSILPLSGIPEDPVTGSAHMFLTPYWAGRLGKTTMEARQLSERGGELHVQLDESAGRVLISGSAAFYLEGKVQVPRS